MSIYDIQQRTDLILKKYAQYDQPAEGAAPRRPGARPGADPFADEYDALDAQVNALLEQAAEVSGESDRAVIAARNAEIRRAKQQLLTEGVEALQKKVKKGKGVTRITVEQREQQVKFLIDRIYSIPDGMGSIRRPFKIGSSNTSSSPGVAAVASLTLGGLEGEKANPAYWKGTDETNAFEQEWEASKKRQDTQLDRIEKGIGALGDMARGMQEEVDRQAPVVDDAEKSLSAATARLKSNNSRIKGVMLQARNRKTWCLEIFLVCIVLSIIAYIVTVLQHKKHTA